MHHRRSRPSVADDDGDTLDDLVTAKRLTASLLATKTVHTTLDRELPGLPGTLPPSTRRRGRWPRAVLLVAVVALLAVPLGLLVSDHVSQDQHFDQLHASVVDTRHQASLETARLGELRHAVATLLSQVAGDTSKWKQDTAELKAAYASLALTQADVSQQSGDIEALHTCLGGVRQVLNALAINDQRSAISSFDSVASSCATASGN